MLNCIENTTNINYLKHVAKLLIQSNLILQDQNNRLLKQTTDHEQLKLELDDKLCLLKKRFFGSKSEKLQSDRPSGRQKELLPHNEPPVVVPSSELSELEQDEIVHYITSYNESCSCPKCGEAGLAEMKGQFEESNEIDVIERTYVQRKHKRQKYRCKACETITTAKGQEKLRPGTKYSIDFAVNIAVDKFSYHLPLERIERQMQEKGLKVDSKQLYSLTEMLYLNLEPIAEKIRQEIHNYGYIHIDETRGKILKTNTNGYIWAICNKFGAYFQYETTRSGAVAEEMLEGFSGTIINDGFSGYNRFTKNKESKIKVTNCWAHARRKFFECKENYPAAIEMLELIKNLYDVEHDAGNFEELARLRKERSSPIIDEIQEWLHSHEPDYLPRSGLGKAIRYTHSLWKGLTHFLEDPQIPLDNNTAERALRNPVKGRDNYNGYMSINGADTAMFFYTIVETCKLLRLNPRPYLSEMARRHWRGEELLTPYEFAKNLVTRSEA
jgi:transposase